MRVPSAIALLLVVMVSGCARIEAQRLALCERVIGALEDGAAPIGALIAERDGDALTVRYRLPGHAEPRSVTCRFDASDDPLALTGVAATATGALSPARVAMLRIWLALDAAPPAPAALTSPAPSDAARTIARPPPPQGALAYLLQLLVNGLVLGALYCLIAVGYAQVFSLLEIVNFAFGELYTVGAYLALVAFVALAAADAAPGALGVVLVLAATIALILPWGWAIERAVYRPLGIARAIGAQRLIPLVSAIGLSLVLENLVRVAQGNRNKWLQPVFIGRLELPLGDGVTLALGTVQLIIVGSTALLCGALWLLLAHTRFGRQQRACAQDRVAAALLGVDVERVISRTFMLGAALAGVAGLGALLYYGQADPSMGYTVGFKALSAAVLGGIGSLAGAMIGGVVIGLAESLWSGYFDGAYRDVVIFGVLIAMLVMRPAGLLGDPGRTSS